MTKHDDKFFVLGRNIADFRKRKGFTQEALAEKIGISRTHMSNIEAPGMSKSVSLEVLFDIADALGITLSQLFEVRWHI
ncbi:MAG: helix-turn-helix transcriptional regulator [Clostridiales bacterium]|nr:helix-turn-helix transcriptional regulator [Clostridiales bacterium]